MLTLTRPDVGHSLKALLVNRGQAFPVFGYRERRAVTFGQASSVV